MILASSNSTVQPHCAFHHPSRWIILAGAAGAAAVAVAGCSASPGTAYSPSSAQRAVKLAASTSQKVDSLTASLTEHLSGTKSGGMTGSVQLRLKPSPIVQARFQVTAAGSHAIQMAEILTGKAIYLKNPAFTTKAGKPWIRINISQLSARSGIGIASMLANLEGSNPLDQTALFTASKDVRAVGSRTVGGVPTTEYAGSYLPADAYAQLSTRMRMLLGPMLRSLGSNRVRFHVWIDAQHLIRKANDTEDVRGQTYLTTFDVTSVNKPVKITLPSSKQIGSAPKA